jgi:hypothetical protein
MVLLSAGGADIRSRVAGLKPSRARFRGGFGRTSATAVAEDNDDDDDDAGPDDMPADMPAGVPGADALAPSMGVGVAAAAAAPAAVAEACPGVELRESVSVELGASALCAQVTGSTDGAAADIQAGLAFPPTATTVSFVLLSRERVSTWWPAAS